MPGSTSIDILVTYDVTTESSAGRRRLRKVAQICEGFGQRVQKSVFECRVTAAQLEELEDRLRRAMAEDEDSLRIYRLAGPRERHVRILGVLPPYDIREPLIV